VPSLRTRLLIGSATAIALTLGVLGGVPASASAPDVITVEGEAPTQSNMLPGATAQAGASGGASLRLYTATAAPAGGYVARYSVVSPEAAIYELTATTIPVNVDWASPYRFRVNDGEWRTTTSATQLAVVSSELRKYRLGAVTLPAGENTIEFQVVDRRKSPNTNYTLFLDSFTLTPVPMSLTAVSAPGRFGVFEAGEDVTVHATLNAAAPGPIPVSWKITDYWGEEVATGESVASVGSNMAVIDLGRDLRTGAYRVEARFAGRETVTTGAFTVLPALADRAAVEDSPFAVDVYGSKLIATGDAEKFARVLQLTGVDWIRDRQRWNDVINPSPGAIDFTGETQPQAWLKAADAAGLKTMSSFHDGPAWTRTSTRELPQDLRDMYDFALSAGEHYDGLVDAWQLWNEQNRKFTLESEGADRYASVMKAAALGFLDSGTDAQLIGGGLAGVDPHYAQWQFRNGILDYLDAFAYHTHTTVNTSATVNQHPDFASQLVAAEPFGGSTKGRWVSESGIALNTADATQLPSAVHEQLQARYIVSSAAQSLAQGSTKQFFFIAAPYREGASYWSMYRSPDEPMAALAAQSVMTDTLGDGRYRGRIGDLPATVEAYVFDTGRAQAAVLWSPEHTTVDVGIDGGAATVTDLMGRETDAAVSGSIARIELGPDPVYVTAAGIGGVVDAPEAASDAAQVVADDFSAAERVVIQQVFDADTSKNSQTHGYGLVATAPTSLTVEVYNFNDREVSAQIEAAAEGGWQVGGGSPTVSVPAGGRVEVPFTISAGADLVHSASDLTIVAKVDGEASSPSVAELRPRTAAFTAAHVIDGVDDKLRVTYTNATSTAQQITGAKWTFDGDTEAVAESIEVAPGATISLLSSPAPAGAGEIPYQATVSLAGGTSASTQGLIAVDPWRSIPRLAQRTVAVDGVLDDLAGVPSQRLSAPGADAGSLDATAWFTWDAEHLFLSTRVHDDRHAQPFAGNATWQADGLQFAVAPNWPGETALRPEIQPRIEFGFALTPQGAQLYRYASGTVGGFLTNAQVAVARDDATGATTYEAAVPWSLLAPIGVTPESAASLSIAANDSDGTGTRGWVQWGGGITTAKDSEQFEPVIFAADSTAQISGPTKASAQCWGLSARLINSVLNDSAGSLDVRFSTPYGEHVLHDVAHGQAVDHGFASGDRAITDGSTLTVMAVDGATRAVAQDGGHVTCG